MLVCFSLSAESVRNGTVIKTMEVDGVPVTVRKHEQIVEIGYSARDYEKVVYDSPFSQNTRGLLSDGDVICIREIYIVGTSEIWLRYDFGEESFFMLYEKSESSPAYDFYADNRWQVQSVIDDSEQQWHVLRYTGSYMVYTNLNIRDTPGLKGKKIGMIEASGRNGVPVSCTEITEEKQSIDGKTERWAKITWNGVTGWVFGGYLDFERGGSRFITPEWKIDSELGEGI